MVFWARSIVTELSFLRQCRAWLTRFWIGESGFRCDNALSPALYRYRFPVLNRDTGRQEQFFARRTEVMKSRNAFTDTEGMTKIVFRSDIAEEEKNSGPSPAEIRQRAFEIHIERGGIHGCDLDDWLQAERGLQEKYKNNGKGTKKN
jgi:Protein of unknown function (DUF2934)